MVQLEHVNTIVRWYSSKEDLDNNRAYLAVCSLFWLSPKVVFVYAMNGSLNKSLMKEFFQELQNLGIKQIIAERKGKMVFKDIDQLLLKAK